MVRIGIAEAKAQWFGFLVRVALGEDVLVTRYGNPVARLIALKAPADG
jgi:prevent-host-death family protein